jgi:hypothetical protein
MLDIRDFGAKGGTSDDTRAIQSAIDAAAEHGDAVCIPAGEWRAAALRMRSRVTLTGHAGWSYRAPGGSVLKMQDTAAPCLIDMTGAIGATIEKLSLDAERRPGTAHGILIDKPEYGQQEDVPRIDCCRISGFPGHGIRLGRIWCFTIRHSMIAFSGGHAISLRGWDGFILDNWLSGNGGWGMAAEEENASVTFTGNRVEWNHAGGLLVSGGDHYNVTGNFFDRSGGPALALRNLPDSRTNNISVTGNVLRRSGAPNWGTKDELDRCHLRLDGARNVVATGNTLSAGRDDGGKGTWSPQTAIVLGGLRGAVVRDNVMDGAALGKLIVDLGGHEDTIVEDNPGSLFVP